MVNTFVPAKDTQVRPLCSWQGPGTRMWVALRQSYRTNARTDLLCSELAVEPEQVVLPGTDPPAPVVVEGPIPWVFFTHAEPGAGRSARALV